MGSFYTNITLVGTDADAVASWLQGAGRDAFVADAAGAVMVFDAVGASQDGSHIELARQLSGATGSRVLAVLGFTYLDRGEGPADGPPLRRVRP